MRLPELVKKYKIWIILVGVGVSAYLFFLGKFFHDKQDSLYEVILMQISERNETNIVE